VRRAGSINRGAEIEDNPFRKERTVLARLRAGLRSAVFWRHRDDTSGPEKPEDS
jgi:hypothetical protein